MRDNWEQTSAAKKTQKNIRRSDHWREDFMLFSFLAIG
jgi:hypothetical protein